MSDILSETSPCFGSSTVDSNFRYSTLGVIAWNLLPFSRGNVKITVISLASIYCYSLHIYPTRARTHSSYLRSTSIILVLMLISIFKSAAPDLLAKSLRLPLSGNSLAVIERTI